MHPKSLKIFCDIVRSRSFSRAASEHGISQSRASQIVDQLEEHLGVLLLDRTTRPLGLTPEGEVYYEGCRRLVARYFVLEEQVRTLHQEVAGRVSVASIYSIGLSHMNRIVQNFLKQYPKANVRLQYQHPHRVIEMVENDQVDLGLVSYPKSSRSIKATVWREEPMVLVCSPTHPLAKRESVSLDELDGLELVGFDPDLEIRHEIDRALASHNVEMRIAMEFDNTETIKQAVEINAGVSLLPRPTVDREVLAKTLVAIPLSGIELKRPIGIICARGKELGSTAQRFMQLLLSQPEVPREIQLDEESELAHLDDRASASQLANHSTSDELADHGATEPGELATSSAASSSLASLASAASAKTTSS
ncbi:transcriptional regulator, LysR family [Pirellula staleyi DSM 6068]|uniref:Transcriptional regulator, LysR family n=1 Tax=Pirellula staleyi (strain ATCC 27377 / DSM 6068 / ICPB 4128) TaxID=530564 RepID=D2R1A9_PIRSD|nr:LysR family transcriptional regulator [Pirellula staleyi]ADB14894.1 transcriptional regulator, LysR family [Pirellula staleyi DSM 6068]